MVIEYLLCRRLFRSRYGNIVADSVPETEYQETVNKAKALMSAAEEAVRFASASKRGQ
jgi:anthranilate synthase component 1